MRRILRLDELVHFVLICVGRQVDAWGDSVVFWFRFGIFYRSYALGKLIVKGKESFCWNGNSWPAVGHLLARIAHFPYPGRGIFVKVAFMKIRKQTYLICQGCWLQQSPKMILVFPPGGTLVLSLPSYVTSFVSSTLHSSIVYSASSHPQPKDKFEAPPGAWCTFTEVNLVLYLIFPSLIIFYKDPVLAFSEIHNVKNANRWRLESIFSILTAETLPLKGASESIFKSFLTLNKTRPSISDYIH